MKTRIYKDPYLGDITLYEKESCSRSALGEYRTDSLYSDDRGNYYLFTFHTSSMKESEPIYLENRVMEMIWKAMGGTRQHVRKCSCDPSTFPPLRAGVFQNDFCWKCDASRDRKQTDLNPTTQYDSVKIAQELDLSFLGSKLLAVDEDSVLRYKTKIEQNKIEPGGQEDGGGCV